MPIAPTVNLHRIIALLLRLWHIQRRCPTPRLPRLDPIHHTRSAARPQLIDRTDSIDGGMQRASSIEVLLDGGQQIFLTFSVALAEVSDPGRGEGFVRRHAGGGVDGETAADEFAGGEGDAAPVFEGCEGVIGDEDGLHFFEVGVAVEGSITAKEEVGDDADCPDIARMGQYWNDEVSGTPYTGFPCPVFLKISGAM